MDSEAQRTGTGSGWALGARGSLPWGSWWRCPEGSQEAGHTKEARRQQREPSTTFYQTINNGAPGKCGPSSEWRLQNRPLLSNHLMTPRRAEGLTPAPLLCTEVYKEKPSVKRVIDEPPCDGGRAVQLPGTPFWSRTRVMKKELAADAPHMSSPGPERPLWSPAPLQPGAPRIYYFPPIVSAAPHPRPSPLPPLGRPLLPPSAHPPPAPSLSHNSILFTETNCLASGCT